MLQCYPKTEDMTHGYRTVRGVQETFPEQAVRYAWHLKLDWVVLTNFEETRLYYSHVIHPRDGLVFKLDFREYLDEDKFSKLWLISKESVLLGELDRYEKRRLRKDVDEELLKDLIESRKNLLSNIRKNNPDLNADKINKATQKILNRLLFVRSCEDHLIIPGDSLWTQFETWQKTAINKSVGTLMMDLKNMFRDFDAVYNGKLFEYHICEELRIDNSVLENIIKTFYKYNFDWIPVDVLGNAYELYIGTIIKEKEGSLSPEEEVVLVEDPGVRKKHGIYYIPIPIVDFIVQYTLGDLLKKCSLPEEVSKIKVIDPACGSGSFLIRAFDYFYEWYRVYNEKVRENAPSKIRFYTENKFVLAVKKKILLDNLYGVDLDPQAIDIAILNLGLKSIEKAEGLPYINDHIRLGNSLIGTCSISDEIEQKKLEEISKLRDMVKELELNMSLEEDVNKRIECRRKRDQIIVEQEKVKKELVEKLNNFIQKLVLFDNIQTKHPLHWAIEFPEVFVDAIKCHFMLLSS